MIDSQGIHNGLSSRICLRLYFLSSRAARANFMTLARVFQNINRVMTGADIDCLASVDAHILIPHTVGIVIGETAVVEAGVCLMPHVTLGARRHANTQGRRHPKIMKNAYIGAGAVLVGTITVGVAAVVGANAVVLQDVDAGTTVVGVPAKKVLKS